VPLTECSRRLQAFLDVEGARRGSAAKVALIATFGGSVKGSDRGSELELTTLPAAEGALLESGTPRRPSCPAPMAGVRFRGKRAAISRVQIARARVERHEGGLGRGQKARATDREAPGLRAGSVPLSPWTGATSAWLWPTHHVRLGVPALQGLEGRFPLAAKRGPALATL
jgi:hypothetical protein